MAEKETMTFWEHLDQLRGVIVRAVVAVCLFAVAAFFFKEELFDIVLAPKQSTFITFRLLSRISPIEPFSVNLINTGLASQFMIHAKVALYAGVFCAAPYMLYLVFSYVSPALYANERRYAVALVGSGYAMFIIGTALGYFLIFPFTVRFLGDYQVSQDVPNLITLESYIETFMMLNLLMGAVFEIPILCWLLAKFGLLKADFMRRYRRHAVVIILVAAAIITPTTDVFTLLLVSVPILLLYEASIVLVSCTSKK